MLINVNLRKHSGNIAPEFVRVSLGTAVAIGLVKGKLDAAPTTAYLMTHKQGKCNANCGFCPQSRESSSREDMLSRISWPSFPIDQVTSQLQRAAADGTIKRVCIQTLHYPEAIADVESLVRTIHKQVAAPISVSCQPLSIENVMRLVNAGAERIGIPLDAATEEVFNKVKGRSAGGPYRWRNQLKLLRKAAETLGENKVSTHLIVGLGETEKEMFKAIQRCVDMGVQPALFAFTPIRGTALEKAGQPPLQRYRGIQLARYLILHKIARFETMQFEKAGNLADFGVEKERLDRIIKTGEPFLTSGCPNCNRPYYNEKPSGPFYNYPRPLSEAEIADIKLELRISGE
ncbi:MAG: radical SAM protein [Candidatus Bathyarchaeota archaeon]|nr:radical SAM protein [Candidatus Bathyarchaeota archaeon]